MKNEWIRENCWTVRGVAIKANVKIAILEHLIETGKIESKNGLIRKSDVKRIVENKEAFVSFYDYVMGKVNERFDPRYVKNRNALWEFMEDNHFWGITIHNADEMLFTYSDSLEKYISINDIDKLDEKVSTFLELYDLGIYEQIRVILEKKVKDKRIKTTYMEFAREIREKQPKYYTKALVEVSKILEEYESDIFKDTPEVIEELIGKLKLKREQEIFAKYHSFLKQRGLVEIKSIKFESDQKKGIKAYDDKTYANLAKCIFNEDMIEKNQMVEKALKNSFFAELWMFWACFFVDGWRGNDSCEKWIYPMLEKNKFINEFCVETLYEDILNKRISEKQYSKVAKYCLKACELEAQRTLKTGEKTRGILIPAIREENLPFYGRLELIAEVHHNKTGEGYMKSNRINEYRNKYKGKAFFGEDFYETLNRENGQVRRMNKSFLQANEMISRKRGHTPIAAQSLVSLARNHSNLDSISAYLSDHSIDGECADVVLSMLIERGVMGAHIYQVLKDLFPDAFHKLPSAEQTKFMSSLELSPLDIEMGGNAILFQKRLIDLFKSGKEERETDKILTVLYEIGNGKGLAKDKGIFCIKRAVGEKCDNGRFSSCIANDCPYLVFTKYGIDSLLEVIFKYFQKYEETKNVKYFMVIKQIIIPKYKKIIENIMKGLNNEEQTALLKYLEEKNDREKTKKDYF